MKMFVPHDAFSKPYKLKIKIYLFVVIYFYLCINAR